MTTGALDEFQEFHALWSAQSPTQRRRFNELVRQHSIGMYARLDSHEHDFHEGIIDHRGGYYDPLSNEPRIGFWCRCGLSAEEAFRQVDA
jgi:hypothetical protein